MSRRTVLAAAVPAVTGLLLVSGAAGAWATGSDDTHVPYDVTADGVTLPAGDTFSESDHVNVRYTYRGKDGSAQLHIEHDRRTGKVIGKHSVSWETVGVPDGSCITWVQVSGYDEHFGEGHQQPVCQVKCRHSAKPTPTPSPSATPAQKTPEVEETPAPEQTPDVEETPAPEATPEVPAVVDADEPTEDTTPDVTETPAPAAQPESTPQPEATPTVPSAVLADDGDDAGDGSGDTAEVGVPSAVLADESPDDTLAVTGSDALLPGLLLAFAALGGGAALRAVHLRKRYTPNHRL